MQDARRVHTKRGSQLSTPDRVFDEWATRPATGPGAPDVGTDEAAADDARRLYQSAGMAPLRPDQQIASLLAPDERVLTVWPCASFERRPASQGAVATGHGVLYLTSKRLVVFSDPVAQVGLDEIEEAMVTAGRLLLVLRDGAGIALDVDGPRLLRVEIATARAAARA